MELPEALFHPFLFNGTRLRAIDVGVVKYHNELAKRIVYIDVHG